MTRAARGSSVTVSYIGTLDNGRIFHSTDEEGPLTFTIGADQVFPALEQAVIGMKAGEVKNILLQAGEAYGQRQQANILKVPRTAFPPDRGLAVGQKLSIDFKGGISKIMVCGLKAVETIYQIGINTRPRPMNKIA